MTHSLLHVTAGIVSGSGMWKIPGSWLELAQSTISRSLSQADITYCFTCSLLAPAVMDATIFSDISAASGGPQQNAVQIQRLDSACTRTTVWGVRRPGPLHKLIVRTMNRRFIVCDHYPSENGGAKQHNTALEEKEGAWGPPLSRQQHQTAASIARRSSADQIIRPELTLPSKALHTRAAQVVPSRLPLFQCTVVRRLVSVWRDRQSFTQLTTKRFLID